MEEGEAISISKNDILGIIMKIIIIHFLINFIILSYAMCD
jgi:hypothetical protein